MVDHVGKNEDDGMTVMDCVCKKTEDFLDCQSCLYFGCLGLEPLIIEAIKQVVAKRFEYYRNDRYRKHLHITQGGNK